MSVKELREKRAALFTRMRGLRDKHRDENQEWTDDDRSAWQKVNEEFDELSGRIADEGMDERVDAIAVEMQSPIGDRSIGREDFNTHLLGRHGRPDGVMFRNQRTGEIVRSIGADERLSRVVAEREGSGDVDADLDVGRLIRGLITGRLGELSETERRSVATVGGIAGGFLLTEQMSSIFLDLARGASVCMRAGAGTLPLDTTETVLARLDSDPTASWKPEGATVTASEPSFGQIVVRPKSLKAIVPITIEMAEDAPNAATIIRTALQAAMGLALDRAGLVGLGAANEPMGIRHCPSVHEITAVGFPNDYDEPREAVGDIFGANFPGDPAELSWILHPRDGESYDGLLDGDGQPIVPTPWTKALKRFYTTSLPTDEGDDESVSIIGHFPSLLFGMRTSGVVIRVLDAGTVVAGNDQTVNAASQFQKLIVAHLRADTAILRPTWFARLTGITTG